MSTITTVFWPEDIRDGAGFAYGWVFPSPCVAGILNVELEHEARDLLKAAISDFPGQEPSILGRCSFDGNEKNLLGLTLEFPSVTNFILALYTRHSPSSLRFHALSLKEDNASKSSPKADFARQAGNLDFTRPTKGRHSKLLNGDVILQFNSAKLLEQLVLSRRSATRARSPLDSLWFIFDLFIAWTSPIYSALAAVIASLSRIVLWPALTVKDASATVHQIDLRIDQMSFLVSEIPKLRSRNTSGVADFAARYINFFNTVWLILNDITLGYALGSFLRENDQVLSLRLQHFFNDILVSWPQWVLHWLDSWPAGLKLNSELSWFYSRTFIDLIHIWGRLLQATLLPYLSTVLSAFGIFTCLGGMTLAISLFADLLSLLTTHIYLCYVITNGVYERILGTSRSLWNLFRGKRYNALRNRVDSWEYDIDQLLFGTILFTLVAFLFPTVLAYYSLFALMRFGTIAAHAIMDVQVAFMNHFPLFALMLRVKDPWRLPGGIYFDIPQTQGSPLTVKNQPIPLSSIFYQYTQLWKRLASHYNPLRLLYRVLSGKTLEPIPRYSIRYRDATKDESRVVDAS